MAAHALAPWAAAPLCNQVLRVYLQPKRLETSHYHVPDTLLRMLVKVGAHLLPHVGGKFDVRSPLLISADIGPRENAGIQCVAALISVETHR